MFISEDLKDRIHALLEKFPSMRDNRMLLTTALWAEDLTTITGKLFPSYDEFTDLLKQGKLSHMGSIGRYMRMLAKEYPHLGGNNIGKRRKNEVRVKQHVIEQKQKQVA